MSTTKEATSVVGYQRSKIDASQFADERHAICMMHDKQICQFASTCIQAAVAKVIPCGKMLSNV